MTDYLHIQLPPDQMRGISCIGLAHMGDAVYELLVRDMAVRRTARPPARACTRRPSSWLGRAPPSRRNVRRENPAPADGGGAGRVPPGPQRAAYTPSHSTPAALSTGTATALEALLGWLYLSGQSTSGCSELFDDDDGGGIVCRWTPFACGLWSVRPPPS